MAHASQESHIHDDPQWENFFNTYTESIEREAEDVQQNQAAASPSEFSPDMKGRLFTAMDSTISSDCELHPTASLLYGRLLPALRATFERCPMYLEKHLDYVNYLLLLSSNEMDEVPEAAERERLKRLGIQIPTEEGDNKKWQCSVVGCKYKGTLQHLVSHLRKKAHLGIPVFACPLGCGKRFHHSQDRDRHQREETCRRSIQVEEAAGPQRSGRPLRGPQQQNPAQTSAHSAEDLRTRRGVHQRPRPQASVPYHISNRSIPSTSSARPIFDVPLHQTTAYQHAQLPDVSFARQGNTRVHPAYRAPQSPDIFRTPYILPINHGGMHADSIINNYHIDNPINNPYAVPGLPPNVTHPPPHSVPHPPHSSNQHSYQTPDGWVQHSQGHPPYNPSGHPYHDDGGGRKVTRPRTSMPSGRTPVAPSLQIDPQDPTTTIGNPSPSHGPQTGYPYSNHA